MKNLHQYANFFTVQSARITCVNYYVRIIIYAHKSALCQTTCLLIGAVKFMVLPRAHRVAKHQLRLAGDDFAGSTSRACDHRAPSIEPPSLVSSDASPCSHVLLLRCVTSFLLRCIISHTFQSHLRCLSFRGLRHYSPYSTSLFNPFIAKLNFRLW